MVDTIDMLGKLVEGNPGRDAVHIAVIPMVAACNLEPGEHVGVRPDGRAGLMEKCLGVVDPFLGRVVLEGQRFWLFLYPKSITSLRHEWTHDAFPTTTPNEVNEVIKNYLAKRQEADRWAITQLNKDLDREKQQ